MSEVLVEREGGAYAQALHDDEADRVGEGAVLVGVAEQDVPGPPLVPGANAYDGGVAAFDFPEKLSGLVIAQHRQDEGMALDNQRVGGVLAVTSIGKLADDGHGPGVAPVSSVQ